jgi:hypothetical protein
MAGYVTNVSENDSASLAESVRSSEAGAIATTPRAHARLCDGRRPRSSQLPWRLVNLRKTATYPRWHDGDTVTGFPEASAIFHASPREWSLNGRQHLRHCTARTSVSDWGRDPSDTRSRRPVRSLAFGIAKGRRDPPVGTGWPHTQANGLCSEFAFVFVINRPSSCGKAMLTLAGTKYYHDNKEGQTGYTKRSFLRGR